MENNENEDLKRRHLSNTENYDKAVLTLSSTGLMFSIAIVNFIGNSGVIAGQSCIYSAWVFFIISIFLSLLSFITANKAVEQSYIENQKSCDKYSTCTKYLNYFSGFFLIVAFIAITIFARLNIN